MTSELEELFARDPLDLSKQDIRTIIEQLRKMRTAPARKVAAKRTSTRRRKAPSSGLDTSKLEIKLG